MDQYGSVARARDEFSATRSNFPAMRLAPSVAHLRDQFATRQLTDGDFDEAVVRGNLALDAATVGQIGLDASIVGVKVYLLAGEFRIDLAVVRLRIEGRAGRLGVDPAVVRLDLGIAGEVFDD